MLALPAAALPAASAAGATALSAAGRCRCRWGGLALHPSSGTLRPARGWRRGSAGVRGSEAPPRPAPGRLAGGRGGPPALLPAPSPPQMRICAPATAGGSAGPAEVPPGEEAGSISSTLALRACRWVDGSCEGLGPGWRSQGRVRESPSRCSASCVSPLVSTLDGAADVLTNVQSAVCLDTERCRVEDRPKTIGQAELALQTTRKACLGHVAASCSSTNPTLLFEALRQEPHFVSQCPWRAWLLDSPVRRPPDPRAHERGMPQSAWPAGATGRPPAGAARRCWKTWP